LSKSRGLVATRTGQFGPLLVILALALAPGCATPPKRNPLPENLYEKAQVAGIPNARYWGDEAPPFAEIFSTMSPEERQARYPALVNRPLVFLAISGGGSNGAFTSGLLNGWTDAGDRPDFAIVTGISTGALIAPFAFLGPEYDDKLKEVYTTVTDDDIFVERGLGGLIELNAVADSAPLRATIAKYIDGGVMQAVADEYRQGRILLIGTTNLDAGRPVVWNIGQIAISGAPEALDLIRDVMLASASIPVAFPPHIFQVDVDGTHYDEMHVDGGITRQSFIFSFGVDAKTLTERLGAVGQPRVYVIRNARLKPQWQAIDRSVIAISGRSTNSMIRTQGIGDLYSEYAGAAHWDFDFNFTSITSDFDPGDAKEGFNPEFMGKLYQFGYDLARNGNPWQKAPPGLTPQ
jgi:hypothetical protein